MSGPRSASSLVVPPLEAWEGLLRRFPLAAAELAARCELSRRSDAKFPMPVAAAFALTHALVGEYEVLAAGDQLVASYRTLYFDTEELDSFHAHRRGFRIRHKVRIREYPDRRLATLEVKTRRSEIETIKRFRERVPGDSTLSPEERAFVADQTGIAREILPQVETEFRRITLLGPRILERVTIDLGFSARARSRCEILKGVAIVEVKQWPEDRTSPVRSVLRAAGHRQAWVSKYCSAIALTHPLVRFQPLGPELRALERAAA